MDKKYGLMELKGAVYMSPFNLGTKLNTNPLTKNSVAEISLESSRMPG
jgi:hypothetical protein